MKIIQHKQTFSKRHETHTATTPASDSRLQCASPLTSGRGSRLLTTPTGNSLVLCSFIVVCGYMVASSSGIVRVIFGGGV